MKGAIHRLPAGHVESHYHYWPTLRSTCLTPLQILLPPHSLSESPPILCYCLLRSHAYCSHPAKFASVCTQPSLLHLHSPTRSHSSTPRPHCLDHCSPTLDHHTEYPPTFLDLSAPTSPPSLPTAIHHPLPFHRRPTTCCPPTNPAGYDE